MGQAEGPVWWKDGGYLLFSDINGNRRIKYQPGQGASVFRDNTNRANGLTRDMQGRLVACEAEAQRVTRLEPDGSISREVMGDFLHPTAKGYEIWSAELEPVLRKLLGEPEAK